MQNWAGGLLIVGSILFLAAAFNPHASRIFRPGLTADEQIEIVEDSPTAWTIVNLVFGAGSVVAVAGLFAFAGHISVRGVGSAPEFAVYLAAIVAAVGAAFWLIVVYYRIAHTPEEVFANGSLLGGWLFPTYTVLTQLALLAIGYVLLQAGFPGWLGWGMIVLVGLTMVAMVIFRDMPPFIHYVWILVMGIMVMRAP